MGTRKRELMQIALNILSAASDMEDFQDFEVGDILADLWLWCKAHDGEQCFWHGIERGIELAYMRRDKTGESIVVAIEHGRKRAFPWIPELEVKE